MEQLSAAKTTPASHHPSGTTNVNETERFCSTLGGAAIVMDGVRRGKLRGIMQVLVGGLLVRRGVTGHCNVYQALNFNTADSQGSALSLPDLTTVKIHHTFTINRPAAELYRCWRDFNKLPRFMQHLEAVEVIDDKRSHWKAKGPLGTHVEWDAEITHDEPNELIGWCSLPGSDIANAGSVRFTPAPAGRGTEVHVRVEYAPPAGVIGATLAKLLLEEPERQIREDLRRFKQLMETGEIPTIEGQPQGPEKSSAVNSSAVDKPRLLANSVQ